MTLHLKTHIIYSELDLGCGEGGYSRELAKRGATLTGADCSHGAIEYCIKAAVSVDIAWLRKIPIFMFWELRK